MCHWLLQYPNNLIFHGIHHITQLFHVQRRRLANVSWCCFLISKEDEEEEEEEKKKEEEEKKEQEEEEKEEQQEEERNAEYIFAILTGLLSSHLCYIINHHYFGLLHATVQQNDCNVSSLLVNFDFEWQSKTLKLVSNCPVSFIIPSLKETGS